MEDGGPDPAPSPRRANPSQFITLPLPVRVLGAPALAGVASSNQVLRSLPSAGHSTSPPPAAGARKKERKERKKRKARGGKKKKRRALASVVSSVPGLEPARPQNICRRSNSPPRASSLLQEKTGKGVGEGAEDKIPRGALDFFFFFYPLLS